VSADRCHQFDTEYVMVCVPGPRHVPRGYWHTGGGTHLKPQWRTRTGI